MFSDNYFIHFNSSPSTVLLDDYFTPVFWCSILRTLIFIFCWWLCCLIYWSNQKKTSTTIYIYVTFSTCTHIVCLANCHHRWTFYVPKPSICVQGSIPFQLLRDIDPINFLFCLLSFQAAYNLSHFIKPFLDLMSFASHALFLLSFEAKYLT